MRPCDCEQPECVACRLYRTSPAHRRFWDTGERPKVVDCPALGERLEFRSDCKSGLMCEHRCTSTDPRALIHLGGVAGDLRTVPGRDCGECPANPKNAVSPAPDTLPP